MKDFSCLFNARDFIRFWFPYRSLSVQKALANPLSINTMILDYGEFLLGYSKQQMKRLRGVKETDLKYAYEEYIAENATKERIEILEAFRCAKEDRSELELWIKAITGEVDVMSLSVISHWLWMVKRRGYGLDTVYQIMPIIFGEQNGGKSSAVTALIKPLHMFQLNMGLQQISDERRFEAMSQHLIIFFDEMQGAERTDMSALKNQITTKRNSYRKLYTHGMATVPMTCSFIGATNKNVNEMLYDSTGMRRFFEIKALDKLDWKVINNLDYDAVWRGIDENRDYGYLVGDVLDLVLDKQKLLVNEEDIEVYIREREITKPGPTKSISATILFKDYERWYTEAGIKKPLSRTTFVRRLQNRNVPTHKEREVLYFTISASAHIIGGEDGKVLSMPV